MTAVVIGGGVLGKPGTGSEFPAKYAGNSCQSPGLQRLVCVKITRQLLFQDHSVVTWGTLRTLIDKAGFGLQRLD